MSDVQSFLRQWLVLRLLTARGVGRTVQELAVEFSVNEKTIRRDFDALRLVGFEFSETTGPHNQKTWKINTDSALKDLVFTFEEVAALYLGRRFLDPLANTHLWDAAQKAFRKIRAGLGADRVSYLENLASAFHQTAIGESDYAERSEIIDHLMLCTEDRKAAAITYRSLKLGEDKTSKVEPYGLIYHRARLYLVAFSREHQEIRHYKIDRVTDVDILNAEGFTRPAEFDLQDHLANTFGVYHSDKQPSEVRIRFKSEVADYIQEHRWHTSQTVEVQTDGSVLVTMQLSELEEVKAWIQSFGAKAIVEEPSELKAMITADLEELQRAYQ